MRNMKNQIIRRTNLLYLYLRKINHKARSLFEKNFENLIRYLYLKLSVSFFLAFELLKNFKNLKKSLLNCLYVPSSPSKIK